MHKMATYVVWGEGVLCKTWISKIGLKAKGKNEKSPENMHPNLKRKI